MKPTNIILFHIQPYALIWSFAPGRIDVNADNFISTGELEDWIIAKVQEHFDEAIEENENVFKALDTDNDGTIFFLLVTKSIHHLSNWRTPN